ncbi:circadian clock protein KaiC [Candidatus Micrarchaeota archaeon]|nr:circadian clock protein KaiC [Candidatus Micrarchaeota archaeon]
MLKTPDRLISVGEMAEIQRASTGVTGLDGMLEGGYPRGRTILISGACGTGKTIFCMQFLYKGALMHKEPGLFLTFDEAPNKIREDLGRFGWDLRKLEEQGLLAIFDATSIKAGVASDEKHAAGVGAVDLEKLFTDVMKTAREMGVKRMAIDSIPAMAVQAGSPSEVRRAILKIAYLATHHELTTLITTEIDEQSASAEARKFSHYGIEEYVSDGVIVLNFLGSEKEASRTLYIRKMRATKHNVEINPVFITDQGIVVKSVEEVFG